MTLWIEDYFTLAKEIEPLAGDLAEAIGEIESLQKDTGVMNAIATVQRLQKDPKLTKAIATFKKALVIYNSLPKRP